MTERNKRVVEEAVDAPRADVFQVRRVMRSSVDLTIFDRNPNIAKSRANLGSVSTK